MTAPLSKNQTVQLCPDSVNESGDGISRVDGGFVVFAKGLLPGERGTGKIIKVCQNYAIARVISRENDSELRREIDCPYALKGCGGCAFPHVTRAGQLKFARQRVVDCLTRIGGLDNSEVRRVTAECMAPDNNRFRNKTVYPFFEIDGAVRTGFYARSSHRPVAFEPGVHCPHENPIAARIRETAEKLARELSYSAYDETHVKGLLRHMTVRISDHYSTAMAIISVNARSLPRESKFVSRLTAAVPELVSLWLDSNTEAGNAVSAGNFRLLSGSEKLECRIGPAKFMISPASFFQVSTAGAETLYDAVYGLFKAGSGQWVYDLYCGAGTIGIYVLKRFLEDNAPARDAGIGGNDGETGCRRGGNDVEAGGGMGVLPDGQMATQPVGNAETLFEQPRLLGVEIVPDAVDNARDNALLNGIDGCRFIAGDVPKIIRAAGRAPVDALSGTGIADNISIDLPTAGTADNVPIDLPTAGTPCTVIIDPPRKGTTPELIDSLLALAPDNIIYVSCNPATLARDLKAFCSCGAYRLEKVQPVDVFPDTGHVETVCLLSQRKPDTTIEVDLDISELEVSSAETKATYEEIKSYVLEKYGLKVSNLYIAQVKRECGIVERINYNLPKTEGNRVPQCPEDKRKAIKDAFVHFQMI